MGSPWLACMVFPLTLSFTERKASGVIPQVSLATVGQTKLGHPTHKKAGAATAVDNL